MRDIDPGEAVFIDKEGNLFSQQCSDMPQKRPCIFEYVYFSRPDSKIDEISVYKARMRMGSKLAEQIKETKPSHDIDVVKQYRYYSTRKEVEIFCVFISVLFAPIDTRKACLFSLSSSMAIFSVKIGLIIILEYIF